MTQVLPESLSIPGIGFPSPDFSIIVSLTECIHPFYGEPAASLSDFYGIPASVPSVS